MQPIPKPQQSRSFFDDDDDFLSLDLDNLSYVKPSKPPKPLDESDDDEIKQLELEFLSGSQEEEKKEEEKPADNTNICDIDYPIKIGGFSLATVDQYLALNQEEKQNRLFYIFGKVTKFWKTLRIINGDWFLGCTVTDDYSVGHLNLTINSQLLSKIFGYRGSIFVELREYIDDQPLLKDIMVKVSNLIKLFREFLNNFLI